MQKLFTVAVLTGAAQAISMKSMVKEEKMTRAQEDEMVCSASKDEVWAMFDATNTNGDEFLQYGEAKAMVEHMQEKGSASAEAVLHNFDELGEIFDKDNDEQMSWEEFHSGSKCLFGRPKYSWAIEFVENNDDKSGLIDEAVAIGYVCMTLEENKDFNCDQFFEDILLADRKDGHENQVSFKTLWQALKKNKKSTMPTISLEDSMDDAPLTAPSAPMDDAPLTAPMYEMTREEEDAMVCQASTKDIESVFRQVDADNSGKIDLAEGVAHLEKESGISAQLALENLHEMGPLLDMNKDEGVDLDEFLAAAVCSFGKPKYSWMIDFVSNNDEETGMINAADAIGYLCYTLHQEEAFDCGKFAHGVMESAETSFPSVWSALLNSRM